MATIASPLLQRRKEPDEEQLLKLFWNRAELKKELGKLRLEKEKLVDQLRQQESVNLRSEQRLEQLENLLADPLQAANVDDLLPAARSLAAVPQAPHAGCAGSGRAPAKPGGAACAESI